MRQQQERTPYLQKRKWPDMHGCSHPTWGSSSQSPPHARLERPDKRHRRRIRQRQYCHIVRGMEINSRGLRDSGPVIDVHLRHNDCRILLLLVPTIHRPGIVSNNNHPHAGRRELQLQVWPDPPPQSSFDACIAPWPSLLVSSATLPDSSRAPPNGLIAVSIV